MPGNSVAGNRWALGMLFVLVRVIALIYLVCSCIPPLGLLVDLMLPLVFPSVAPLLDKLGYPKQENILILPSLIMFCEGATYFTASQIIANVQKNNIFCVDNVKIFRRMFFFVVAEALLQIISSIVFVKVYPEESSHFWTSLLDVNLDTRLGAALALITLAEIFRYGLALRQEAELTV